jgi:hypothetical protein
MANQEKYQLILKYYNNDKFIHLSMLFRIIRSNPQYIPNYNFNISITFTSIYKQVYV